MYLMMKSKSGEEKDKYKTKKLNKINKNKQNLLERLQNRVFEILDRTLVHSYSYSLSVSNEYE